MDLEDKPDIWDRELVHRIEFDDIYQTIAYEYVQLGPFNKHELLRVIEPGFLTLYAHNETNWIPNFPPELSGGPPSTPISSTRFYLKRKNSDRLFEVVANQRRWKETLKLCFEGCSEVLEEINGENIGNLIIEDLVWNYNEFCADYSN